MINIKKMLSLLLVGAMSVGMLAGCGKKDKNPDEVVYELKPLTAEQLEAGKYYVKNGDTFYELPKGTYNFEEKNAVVKNSSAFDDTTRLIWFGKDDVTIPTLYQDDTLVYVTSTMPDSFTWERYKDYGYTVGVAGLTVNNTGKYSTTMVGANFYPDSTMKAAIANSGANVGDSLVFDSVDKLPIGNGNVSAAGTIIGLQAGKTYSVDVYNGSTYIPVESVEADTHAFGGYEIYTSSICNYMQANYIQVVVPENFVSGYYYINGTGFVRYVDNARAKGIAEVDFNEPYFIELADGTTVTADQLDPEDKDKILVNEEKYYSTKTNIDCSNRSMTIDVTYEDAKGTNLDGAEFVYSDEEVGLPQVKLVDPDGNEDYVFVSSNQLDKTFTITVENPVPGTWETRIFNAEKRMFSVATSFDSGHNDTLVHNGDKGTITYYVPNTMKNAQFTITWTNTTVSPYKDNGIIIKDNKINDPKHEKELTYSRDIVTVGDEDNYKEGRGITTMTVGEIKYGDYTITLDSQYALGRVRVSVKDLALDSTEEEFEEIDRSDEEETKEASEK